MLLPPTENDNNHYDNDDRGNNATAYDNGSDEDNGQDIDDSLDNEKFSSRDRPSRRLNIAITTVNENIVPCQKSLTDGNIATRPATTTATVR